MRVRVITQPASEPVTLDEALAQCRVDDPAEKLYVASLIPAAREVVERESWRALITQTLELALDNWPEDGEIQLPRPPTQSVTSITWLDEAGLEHTIAAGDYIADLTGDPARILPASGKDWPSDALFPLGGIRVRYVAGWAAAENVPAILRQAVLLLIGHLYENREAVSVAAGLTATELPLGVATLIQLAAFREF